MLAFKLMSQIIKTNQIILTKQYLNLTAMIFNFYLFVIKIFNINVIFVKLIKFKFPKKCFLSDFNKNSFNNTFKCRKVFEFEIYYLRF